MFPAKFHLLYVLRIKLLYYTFLIVSQSSDSLTAQAIPIRNVKQLIMTIQSQQTDHSAIFDGRSRRQESGKYRAFWVFVFEELFSEWRRKWDIWSDVRNKIAVIIDIRFASVDKAILSYVFDQKNIVKFSNGFRAFFFVRIVK